MKAIQVSKFGGPEALKFVVNASIPKAGAKEVLVNVKAAGVNPVETYIRSGAYAKLPTLPYIPGSDGAGLVHQVGSEVTDVKPGDRVWFSEKRSGSYAEFCLCSGSNVHHLPDNISFSQGAAIGTPYLTAYRALYHKCHVKPGETVLVHGASGAVGTAAVQFGLASGLNVFGTAGSDVGIALLRTLGVDQVFCHRKEGYTQEIMDATNGKGVDVVIEMLSNVNLDKDLKMLSYGGRVGVVGCRGSIEINPRDTMAREASIIGVMLPGAKDGEIRESVAFIERGMKSGWLQPVVGNEYSIEDAQKAHVDIIEGSGAKGKIVLLI